MSSTSLLPRRPMPQRSSDAGVQVRRIARVAVVAVVALHGLLHLMGAVVGFGWAEVEAFEEPIGVVAGAGWLVAAVAVLASVVQFAIRRGAWWVWATIVVLSQVMIATSWTDARAGTIANVLLAAEAAYGWASYGPRSARAEYRRRVDTVVAAGDAPRHVVERADLADLPDAVADFIAASGALGAPHVTAFRAVLRGRIRSGPDDGWMPFVAEQVNICGPDPTRLFLMDATKAGLPVSVLHVYEHGRATMRARVLGLVTVVDESGPVLDRAETVTVFNDLCVFAPAALIDAPITWEVVGAHAVRGRFVNGHHAVEAVLTFDDQHRLVDFESSDRAQLDGHDSIARPWSTPIGGYRTVGARRLASHGEGRWHDPSTGESFAYIEMEIDEVRFDPST